MKEYVIVNPHPWSPYSLAEMRCKSSTNSSFTFSVSVETSDPSVRLPRHASKPAKRLIYEMYRSVIIGISTGYKHTLLINGRLTIALLLAAAPITNVYPIKCTMLRGSATQPLFNHLRVMIFMILKEKYGRRAKQKVVTGGPNASPTFLDKSSR